MSFEDVSLASLLADYGDNEVRADARFKGKRVRLSGVVGDAKRDLLGTIYVTLGTGAAFELTAVQCYFDDAHAAAVATLSKGQHVTIRGRIDGLVMNVLAHDCELER